MKIFLIVLWVLTIIIQMIFALVIARGDADGDGAGAFKWLIVGLFGLCIFMSAYMGVSLWLLS